MPETPIWLLSRGRYEDAEKALCWLRGWVTPDVVREEFNQLVMYSNAVNKTNFPVTITVSVYAHKNCMYNLH
jgi:SP family facilitated glucose transporter-like MFS transporter 8